MPKLRRRRRRIIRRILIFFAAAIFLALLAGVGLGFHLYDHYAPHRETARKTFSREAMQMSLPPDPIPLDQIPPPFVSAFVVTQEPRFYEYGNRFDWIGLYKSYRAERRIGGPHRIAIQLANQLLEKEESRLRHYSRASALHFLSLEIEYQLTKEETLFYALNSLPFGENSVGAGEGAREHFQKNLNDLSDDELITLALISLNPDYRKPPLPQRMVDETREQLEHMP